MIRIPSLARSMLAITLLSTPIVARADWTVRNNLEEQFTIYVWPLNSPSALQSRILEKGGQVQIPLGQDKHQIELLSKGGDLYILEPANLAQRRGVTNLKTILTPIDEKVEGRIVYKYMNQNGFKEGDADRLDKLQFSVWKTTYATPTGGHVKTDLKFLDQVGTYHGGLGKLSAITYDEHDDHTVIRGNWRHGGSKGTFTFYVEKARPNKFTSARNGGESDWSGDRLAAAP